MGGLGRGGREALHFIAFDLARQAVNQTGHNRQPAPELSPMQRFAQPKDGHRYAGHRLDEDRQRRHVHLRLADDDEPGAVADDGADKREITEP